MDLTEGYYILGVDGGASHSTGILIDDTGKTLAHVETGGMSISINKRSCPMKVVELAYELCKQANISAYDIDAIGLGMAGSSNEDGRDLIFREIEKEKLTRSTLITSDAEAAYEVTCPVIPGFLVSVGTGVICMARTEDGKIHRTAGIGHQQGDKGGGYWIGRQVLMAIAIGESHIYPIENFLQLKNLILDHFEETDFATAVEKITTGDDHIEKVASLAKPICKLAENGNEMALSVIQEATQYVGDYIVELAHKAGYKEKNIVLGGNGSLCKNNLYRKALNDALAFDFQKINWLFSKISPAYGGAMLAAKLIDLDIPLEKIAGQV